MIKSTRKVPLKELHRAAVDHRHARKGGHWQFPLTLDDGSHYRVEILVPGPYDPATPLPARLDLHATSAVGDLMAKNPGRVDIKRIGDARGVNDRIEIRPKCNGSTHHWGPSTLGHELVLRSLKLAQAEFNIDPDRIQLTGRSAGARGAQNIALAEPRLWSSVDGQLAGPVSSFNREKFYNAVNLPMRVSTNPLDKLHPPEYVDEFKWALRKVQGSEPEFNGPRIRWPDDIYLVADHEREYRRDWIEIGQVKGPRAETTIHTYSGNRVLEKQKRLVYPVKIRATRKGNSISITARAVRVPVIPEPDLTLPEDPPVLHSLKIHIPVEWKMAGKPEVAVNGKPVKLKSLRDSRTRLTALRHDPTRPVAVSYEIKCKQTLKWDSSLGYRGGFIHLFVYKKQTDEFGYSREIVDEAWEPASRGLWQAVPPYHHRVVLSANPPLPDGVIAVVKAESAGHNVKRLAMVRRGRVSVVGLKPGSYTFTMTCEPAEYEDFKKTFPYLVVNPENAKKLKAFSSGPHEIKKSRLITVER